MARLRTGSHSVIANFNPNQPRDEDGRWTDTGGGGGGSFKLESNPREDYADQALAYERYNPPPYAREAVAEYTYYGHREMNDTLRALPNGTGPDEGPLFALYRTVQNAPPTTKDRLLLRFVNTDPQHEPGSQIVMKGMVSTTSAEAGADGYGYGTNAKVKYEIEVTMPNPKDRFTDDIPTYISKPTDKSRPACLHCGSTERGDGNRCRRCGKPWPTKPK